MHEGGRNSSRCEFKRSSSRHNDDNLDNARDQIANIISYRIITANCSSLPLPASLHATRPLWRPRSPSRVPFAPVFLLFAPVHGSSGYSSHVSPSFVLLQACSTSRDQVRRCSPKRTVNSNLLQLCARVETSRCRPADARREKRMAHGWG